MPVLTLYGKPGCHLCDEARAAVRDVLAGRDAGLIYLDRHADLNVPGSTIDGALDWMGVAHMLEVEGAEPELTGIAGPPPMLPPERIAFLGLAPVSPPEQAIIESLGLPVVSLDRAVADPAGAARETLNALAGYSEIVIHFDVDVLDFLDAPLAENADRAPGLPLRGAATILEELFLDPRTRAITDTVREVTSHMKSTEIRAASGTDGLTGFVA